MELLVSCYPSIRNAGRRDSNLHVLFCARVVALAVVDQFRPRFGAPSDVFSYGDEMLALALGEWCGLRVRLAVGYQLALTSSQSVSLELNSLASPVRHPRPQTSRHPSAAFLVPHPPNVMAGWASYRGCQQPSPQPQSRGSSRSRYRRDGHACTRSNIRLGVAPAGTVC